MMCESPASMSSSQPDSSSVADPLESTRKELIKRYESYLEGKSDTNGAVLESWGVENRVAMMRDQGISRETAAQRADEAIRRTRDRYEAAFIADGNSPPEAAARAAAFLSDPDRCLPIIWAEEKERFLSTDKALTKNFKDAVVWLNLLVLLPAVLLFLSSLPVGPVMEMAKYYVSNNCQAIGGIKCNGVGPQGQTLPSIMRVLTPPPPIKRSAPSPLTRDPENPAPAAADE